MVFCCVCTYDLRSLSLLVYEVYVFFFFFFNTSLLTFVTIQLITASQSLSV